MSWRELRNCQAAAICQFERTSRCVLLTYEVLCFCVSFLGRKTLPKVIGDLLHHSCTAWGCTNRHIPGNPTISLGECTRYLNKVHVIVLINFPVIPSKNEDLCSLWPEEL